MSKMMLVGPSRVASSPWMPVASIASESVARLGTSDSGRVADAADSVAASVSAEVPSKRAGGVGIRDRTGPVLDGERRRDLGVCLDLLDLD